MSRGTVRGRRAPEWIRRRGEVERSFGRCGRIKVDRGMGVAVRGEEMVSGRSGMEAVNRIMRLSGEKDGERRGGVGEAIVGGNSDIVWGGRLWRRGHRCQDQARLARKQFLHFQPRQSSTNYYPTDALPIPQKPSHNSTSPTSFCASFTFPPSCASFHHGHNQRGQGQLARESNGSPHTY